MTDYERAIILLRYEALAEKLQLHSITRYEKSLLEALNKTILAYVSSEDLTDLQRRRLISQEIAKELDPIYKELSENLLTDMSMISEHAGLFAASTFLENPVQKALKFNSKTLLHGYELGDMLDTNNREHIKQFKRIIANGITEGMHSKEVFRELKKLNHKKLSHISHTVVQSAMKEARTQAKKDTFVHLMKKGIIKKIKWVATFELNTCPICRALDGKEWDNFESMPPFPAHFRCKCDIIGGSSKNASRSGKQYYQSEDKLREAGTSFGNITYDEWAKLQPIEVQKAIASKKYISLKKFNELLGKKTSKVKYNNDMKTSFKDIGDAIKGTTELKKTITHTKFSKYNQYFNDITLSTKNKVENAIIIRDEKFIKHIKTNYTSVVSIPNHLISNSVIIHNHPSGMSFSPDDIFAGITKNAKRLIVFHPGTYIYDVTFEDINLESFIKNYAIISNNVEIYMKEMVGKGAKSKDASLEKLHYLWSEIGRVEHGFKYKRYRY